MLLGKRPRPPMKRTTSMSEITIDLNTTVEDDPNNPSHGPRGLGLGRDGSGPWAHHPSLGFDASLDQNRVLATVSPRNHSTHSSSHFSHTPHFLRACFLCKRPLVPARDIYMYRGDSAFCSLECRQKQMKQDERKGKAPKKQVVAQPLPSVPQVTSKGETVIAL